MKTYLLFAGSNYYPSGGAEDFKGFFDSIDEAVTFFEAGYYHEWDEDKQNVCHWDWYHVALAVDMSIADAGYCKD